MKGAPRPARTATAPFGAGRVRPVASPAPAPDAKATWSRSRVLAIGGVLLAALAAGSATVGLLVSRGGADTAAAHTPGPPAVAPAAAFRVVYRIDDTASPDARVETDVVAVRRPDDVRVEHRDGPPPGGPLLSGTIVTRTSQITLGGSGDGFTTPHAPAILPGALSKAALDAAADAGKAMRGGEATILGHRCTDYAYDQVGTDPLGAGDGRTTTTSCVTADDITLRQVVAVAGRTVRSSEAIAVDLAPSFPAGEFATSHPITPSSSGDASDEVDEGPSQGSARALAVQIPPGFTPARSVNVGHSLGPYSAPVFYYAQSFAGDGEQIIVEQALEPDSPWTGRGGTGIDIGNGQPSAILYHSDHVEVDTRAGGLPVRVLASRKDLAVYVASRLRTPAQP